MKYLSSLLELAGAALVFYAVAQWSPEVAMALLGVVLITTGYNLGGTTK